MSTIKTMTLDEVKNYAITPQMAEQMKTAAESAREDGEPEDADCPFLTSEQLSKFRPWYEVHPNDVYIETDIMRSLIKLGKNWQIRMNQYLRKGIASSLI